MKIEWVQFAWMAGLYIGQLGVLVGVIWFLMWRLIGSFKASIAVSIAVLQATDAETKRSLEAAASDMKRHMETADAELKVQIESAHADYKRIDAEFKKFLMELPLHYYRREDAVREFTAISTKLDRLYEIYSKVMKHA
jgi:hypothetical protein